MKKPYVTMDATGRQRVLFIHDGMNEVNKDAIVNQAYDQLCLFDGDWEDLSFFCTVADKVPPCVKLL